jgi:hypothetical protein
MGTCIHWTDALLAVSTAVLAVATIALVVVGFFQVNRFIESEKTKATMDLVTLYDATRHQTHLGAIVSVNTAVSNTLANFRNQNDAQTLRNAILNKNMNQSMTPAEIAMYDQHFPLLTIAVNYFTLIAALVVERKLDESLILDFFSPQIVSVWSKVQMLRDVYVVTDKDPAWQQLVQKAETYKP